MSDGLRVRILMFEATFLFWLVIEYSVISLHVASKSQRHNHSHLYGTILTTSQRQCFQENTKKRNVSPTLTMTQSTQKCECKIGHLDLYTIGWEKNTHTHTETFQMLCLEVTSIYHHLGSMLHMNLQMCRMRAASSSVSTSPSVFL